MKNMSSSIVVNFICISMLLMFGGSLFAANVSGTINGQTWTSAQSPYFVTGDITINDLEIQEGVEVYFQGNHTFLVQGRLIARGTSANRILFAKSSGSGWQGIHFVNALSGSELTYCDIQDAINHGVLIDNTYPTIAHCKITNNSASIYGGGMAIENVDTLLIEDCDFEGNEVIPVNGAAAARGAGLYLTNTSNNITVKNCSFKNNRISWSGSLSNQWFEGAGMWTFAADTIVQNCTFEGNSLYLNPGSLAPEAQLLGAGLCAAAGTTVSNSYFYNNSILIDGWNRNTYTRGGGICFYSYQNTPVYEVTNTIIHNNSVTFNNALVEYSEGGGLFLMDGTCTIENSNFTNNTDWGIAKLGGTLTVINSIVYGNSTGQIQSGSVIYSLVQNGYSGLGNISSNPIFYDEANLDFRLSSISTAVDAGNPDSSYDDACLPPAQGTTQNDMGAFGGPGNCQGIGKGGGSGGGGISITADFSATPTSGYDPLTVNFTDLSTTQDTSITSWEWDFDYDGTVDSSQQHPTHQYTTPGTYTISLIASNGILSDEEIKTAYITVSSNPNPPADSLWTEGSGQDIYRASGNVGIGLTGPQQKLHVYGQIAGEAPVPTIHLQETDTTGINWRLFAENRNFHMATTDENYNQGTTFLTLDRFGYLGIGTETPERELHVAGRSVYEHTAPSMFFKETDTVDMNWQIQLNGGNLWWSTTTDDNTYKSTVMIFKQDGKVGVGTLSPRTALEVNGVLMVTPMASAPPCNADSAGGIYYNSTDNAFYGCNGSVWKRLDL